MLAILIVYHLLCLSYNCLGGADMEWHWSYWVPVGLFLFGASGVIILNALICRQKRRYKERQL